MKKQATLMLVGVALFAGCGRAPCRISNATKRISNDHVSMIWTLALREPVGVAVVASDPSYSLLWNERPQWQHTETWSTIVLTVGDDSSRYRWNVKAEARHRGHGLDTQQSGGSRTVSSLSFSQIRAKGAVQAGATLAHFVLQEPGGTVVSGVVKVVAMNEEDTQQHGGQISSEGAPSAPPNESSP